MILTRPLRLAALLALCVGALVAPAYAAVPSSVDPLSQPFALSGSQALEQVSWVRNAGDVNGDGRDDLLAYAENTRTAYVVFGNGTSTPIDLANGSAARIGDT